MDRREFLQTSILGTLATSVLGDVTLARGQAAPAQNATAAAAAPRRLVMDAYSRHLHWLRTADEVAEAAIEMTCGGVNPTIQQYPGHIDPAKVTTELPAFVRTIQKHGLRVKQVRGGNQTQVDASVEAMGGKERSGAQDLGLLGGGGPYPGPQGPPAAAGGGRGGRGRGGAPAGGPPPAAAGRAGGGPPGVGRGEGFAEGDGPPAGFGGRGASPRAFPLPLAGKTFARGGGWNSPYVPMGTGLVDVFRYATVLRDI